MLFSRKREWSLDRLSNYWRGQQSIYELLSSRFDTTTGALDTKSLELPQPTGLDFKELRFAPGALDGIVGFHFESPKAESTAQDIVRVFAALCNKALPANLARLINAVEGTHLISVIDDFLQYLVKDPSIEVDRACALALWLARTSPHVNVVKLAIAILGVAPAEEGEPKSLETLRMFGLHEEFTLYSAVALSNRLKNSEQELFELARRVTGWGRIQVVRMLRGCADPEISRWLLVEGHHNDGLSEYSALDCAYGGRLIDELRAADPNKERIDGALEVLAALIDAVDYPTGSIHDYEHAVESLQLALDYLAKRPLTVRNTLICAKIQRFLDHELDEILLDAEHSSLAELSDAARSSMCQQYENLIAAAELADEIDQMLSAPDASAYDVRVAMRAARLKRIDVWDRVLPRAVSGQIGFSELLPEDNADRLKEILEIARPVLDRVIASPLDERPIGDPQRFRDFNESHAVLTVLGGPWDVVEEYLTACLSCRHASVINRALEAVARIGAVDSPTAIRDKVRALQKSHPDGSVREQALRLIAQF